MAINAVSKAIIKIKETRRPISEDTIGFRIQAAVPNMAGRDFRGNAVPSFRKPYLIAESSDFSAIEDKDYERFTENLRKLHNYTEFEIVAAPKS